MDAESVDVRSKLREGIQPSLGRPPVVSVRPVGAEVLEICERDALRPVVDRLRLRPARLPKAGTKVGEVTIGDVDAKRAHLVVHGVREATNPGATRRSAPGT